MFRIAAICVGIVGFYAVLMHSSSYEGFQAVGRTTSALRVIGETPQFVLTEGAINARRKADKELLQSTCGPALSPTCVAAHADALQSPKWQAVAAGLLAADPQYDAAGKALYAKALGGYRAEDQLAPILAYSKAMHLDPRKNHDVCAPWVGSIPPACLPPKNIRWNIDAENGIKDKLRELRH